MAKYDYTKDKNFGQELQLPDIAKKIEPGSNAAVSAILLQTRKLARMVDVNKPETLFEALDRYLEFCIMANIKVTNKSLYTACGVTDDMVTDWITGRSRTADPRYREFGLTARSVCAQAREQSAAEGTLSPVLAIWWQKNYDGMRDDPIPVKVSNSELERTVDPEEIAQKYKHLLTDDSGERMERDKAEADLRETAIDLAYEMETGRKRYRYKPKQRRPRSDASGGSQTQKSPKKGKSPAKTTKRKEGAE